MTTYILRRMIQGIFVIILATIVIFIAMRILPGDPLMIYIVEQDISFITPELEQQLRHKFGLDKSLVMQYFDWIGGLFRGDMGLSIHYQESVAVLMAKRVPITMLLGLLSFIISSILGMLTGVLAALRRASLLDNILTSFAYTGHVERNTSNSVNPKVLRSLRAREMTFLISASSWSRRQKMWASS